MQALPPDLVLSLAATVCAACAMIVLGLDSKLLHRQRRTCPSCGRWIENAGRCRCAD
jgi:hypothetical protein